MENTNYNNSKQTINSSNQSQSKLNIDVRELIESARKCIGENDHSNGEYLINLSLLSPDDDPQLKITSQAIRSFINYKKSNLTIVLNLARKFLKEVRNQNSGFEQDTCYAFIRTFYRAGDLLLKNKTDSFLSSFFFYRAKTFFENNEILCNNQELKSLIEQNFIAALDGMSKVLSQQKVFFSDPQNFTNNNHQNNINNDLEYIKEYFNNTPPLDENEEKVYLVSTLWIRNMLSFLNKLNYGDNFFNNKNFNDKLFDRKNVCLLYFNDASNKEEYKRYLGNYPGPINNFYISQDKDFWYDPELSENYTNNYLKNGVKENSDFIYLPVYIYEKLKNIFGINLYEIQRKNLVLGGDNLIEIHLRKIKVLLISNLLDGEFKNYLKMRTVQISKVKTVLDLKIKLLRGLLHATNKGNEELGDIQCKVFLTDLNTKSKQEIFQIIYSYTNKFTSFKIKGEEVNDDHLLIENLKIGVKDLLIVEIKVINTDIRKNWFINVYNKNEDDVLLCSLCEKKINQIDPNNKISCEFCDQYIYCSQDCLKNDTAHINFHSNMSKLLKKQFSLNDIVSIPMSELLPKNSSHGLTGLKNLGNTCFMNSALQCLSNCQELTKYFLLKKFLDEVNKKNKYGSGGQIAKAYYELIKELWQGHSNYLSPWDFRQIFVGFVKQFAGFSQHDSHEMLAFMLDALHEDLNRVKDKPYFELNEKCLTESEEEASSRWWSSHLSRENSIIVDLFHGQYKSIITCPDCNRISITYDPFMYLGLPIPQGQCKLKVKFFPVPREENFYNKNFNNFNNLLELELSVNEHTTIGIVKSFIKTNYLNMLKTNQFYNNNLSPDFNIDAVVTGSKMYKKMMNDTSTILNLYENGYEIIFYENEYMTTNPDTINFFATPFQFIEEKSYFGAKQKSILPTFYVKPFTMKKNMTVKDLYVKIFSYYRKIIPDIEGRSYENYILNQNDAEYVYAEFFEYFKQTNVPFKLYIQNNIPHKNDLSGDTCEFCGKNNCENFCAFNFNLQTTLAEVKEKQQIKRPFLILVEICNYSYETILFEDVNIRECGKHLLNQKNNVNIYDCLDSFRAEEKLEKENAWYCSNCKDHKEANKKLEIFKAPNFLIVQFKRFKIKTNNVMLGMMTNKKNDSVIDFPIDDLDLRSYLVSDENKEDAIYELVAISQHFGSLSSGHYTALCRNEGKWYHYDDERVSRGNEKDVVTAAAYLLFYRKRSLNK